MVVIGFEPINYNVRENDGNAVVTVKVLSGSLSESVSVTLTTNDGSAGGVYCTVLYLYHRSARNQRRRQ